MRVTYDMIAPDLRLPGTFYKIFLSGTAKKKSGARKEEKQKHTARSNDHFNVYVKRSDGSDLRILVLPPEQPSRLGVLWIHGGGYVTGMPEMASLSMAKHIRKSAWVFSPAYRLADRDPYPAALEDCFLALCWMVQHSAEFNVSSDQIFVGGESAGGGLTAALCLLARDTGLVNIACQMPLYPMLTNEETESSRDNNAPVWNEKQNQAAWSLYLDGLQTIPKYAVPLKDTDYRNLPPAITFVGTIEPFHDETVEYVEHLKSAGVPVTIREFDGCYHAFDMMVPHSREAKEAVEFFLQAFDEAARTCHAPQPGSFTDADVKRALQTLKETD